MTSSCAGRSARIPRPLLSSIAGEHDCRVLRTIASQARPVAAHPVRLARGFEQIARSRGTGEPGPNLYSEAMTTGRSAVVDDLNPGFPLPRLTDVLQQSDPLVSVRPPGGIPLKAHPRCDGAAGLGFPPAEPRQCRPADPRGGRPGLLRRPGRTRSPRFLPIRRQLPSIA
jgi:hypothetical protein